MDNESPLITHLTYADDTILFSSDDLLSIAMMINKLEKYEQISGQMVNKRKSAFMVSSNTPLLVIEDIKAITSFSHSHFPLPFYLFGVSKKKCYFENMVAKITNRTQGWKGKILSIGVRAVLIRSLLHSLSLHIIYIVYPPKSTLDYIEKSLASFFWCTSECKRIYHWFSGKIYVILRWREG